MISVRTCKSYNRTSIIPIKRSSAIQRPVPKCYWTKLSLKIVIVIRETLLFFFINRCSLPGSREGSTVGASRHPQLETEPSLKLEGLPFRSINVLTFCSPFTFPRLYVCRALFLFVFFQPHLELTC